MILDCEDRTCGRCARCEDAARVFQILSDKAKGRPAPRIDDLTYEDSPILRLLKKKDVKW